MVFIKSKNILNYIIRLFCFSLVVKCAFFYIGGLMLFVFFPLFWIVFKIEILAVKTLNHYELMSYDEFDMFPSNFEINILVCLTAFISLYILAKVFGIFKKLDKLNFFVSLFIIVLISLMLIECGKIPYLVSDEIYANGLDYSGTMYLLIPAFLLYKFFNFLTQKFPTPFKQIGYFFSIEFYRDLYRKLKNKI